MHVRPNLLSKSTQAYISHTIECFINGKTHFRRQVSGSSMLRIVRTDDKDVAQIQIVSVWTLFGLLVSIYRNDLIIYSRRVHEFKEKTNLKT